MFWTSSSGLIELNITRAQAKEASHTGHCDADVFALSQVAAIQRQLARINPADLVDELQGYGAWDEGDLADHEQNLQRVLWLACGDINEEQTA